MKAELLDHFGNDLMVVNAARVSFGKWKKELDEKDEKLIAYLAKHNHFSPFTHPQIQFRITAPIFVARQWFRSTVGVARNETSRRYVADAPEFFIPDTWRSKPEGSVKQGSGESLNDEHSEHCDSIASHVHNRALDAYQDLLDFGVAPEQARMILPQSMETQWIETGSLAYYARICKQRMDGHAQIEVQDLARMVADQIAPLFPVAWPELMS